MRVIDVGTGGGFPGVLLAIARPEWQVLIPSRSGYTLLWQREHYYFRTCIMKMLCHGSPWLRQVQASMLCCKAICKPI